MRKLLTGKQRVIFNYVRQRMDTGVPPTQTEIAAHFGFSLMNACQILNAIARKGYIKWEFRKPRTFTLLPPYADDTRCSLVVDTDIPQLRIRTGDFLLINIEKPVAEGDVILSAQGEIKRFSAGDTAFGKVVSFAREIKGGL